MFNFIIFHLSLDTETSSGSKSLAFWYKEIAFLVLAMRSSVSGSDSASSALPNFLRRTPWVWMYVWAKFRYSEWFSSMALWSLTHWKVFRALDFKHFKETGGKMAVPRDLIMLSIWVMQSASLSTLVRAKRQSLACHGCSMTITVFTEGLEITFHGHAEIVVLPPKRHAWLESCDNLDKLSNFYQFLAYARAKTTRRLCCVSEICAIPVGGNDTVQKYWYFTCSRPCKGSKQDCFFIDLCTLGWFRLDFYCGFA